MRSLQQIIIALVLTGALQIGTISRANAQVCEVAFSHLFEASSNQLLETRQPPIDQSEASDSLINQQLSLGVILNSAYEKSNFALQKLKFFLKERSKVQFNGELFDSKKEELSNSNLSEVSIDTLNSPEAILAYIESQSAINGQSSIDFHTLKERNPKLLRKIVRKLKRYFPIESHENAGPLRQAVDRVRNTLRPKAFSELTLLKIFTDVYFSANALNYPQTLDVKFHYLNIPFPRRGERPNRFQIPTPIPRSVQITNRKEELEKINRLIQLRAEYAAAKYGIVKGLKDMGLEFKFTPRNIRDAALNRVKPLAEAMLWIPKLFIQLMMGYQFRDMAHEVLTNPAFIGKPKYVDKLLNEGWDSVKDEVIASPFHQILAWTQVGTQKLIDKSMSVLRIVMFYYIAFGLNSVGHDYGYINHIYVPTLGEFQQLMNDPVYGSYQISSKVEELISFYRNQCIGPCNLEQESYILVDLYRHLGVQDGSPETASYFFPPEKQELSELIQWSLSSSLGCDGAEFCPGPGSDIPTAEYVLRTLPAEIAEEMTELDRLRIQSRIDNPMLFTFY